MKKFDPYTAWLVPGLKYTGTMVKEVTVVDIDKWYTYVTGMDGTDDKDFRRIEKDVDYYIFDREVDAFIHAKTKAEQKWSSTSALADRYFEEFTALSVHLTDLINYYNGDTDVRPTT